MTKKQVKVKCYRGIHYHAQCKDCDFGVAVHSGGLETRADVREAIRKHVRNTGHSVHLEVGNVTHYTKGW
jgi:hypothetical protein